MTDLVNHLFAWGWCLVPITAAVLALLVVRSNRRNKSDCGPGRCVWYHAECMTATCCPYNVAQNCPVRYLRSPRERTDDFHVYPDWYRSPKKGRTDG